MQKISNIKIKPFEDDRALLSKACKKAGVRESDVKHFKLIKKSLDARDKNAVFYTCTVELSTTPYAPAKKTYGKVKKPSHVLVVGAGPAGLFCALDLLRYGVAVTLIERGKAVDERVQSVSKFYNDRVLDEDCNVQFGEGGAGAFSDGKLNTGVGGNFAREVIDDFLLFGAPKDIGYLQKPHIGSDNLKNVVKNNVVSFTDAIDFATINPAKNLGIDKETGSIKVGKNADLVVMNKETFEVLLTIRNGKVIYKAN